MDLFSRNISVLRGARGLTQTALAKDLHISHQAVSKWEKGKSIPDAEMLTSIARYFGITVDRLLNEEIRFNPPQSVRPPSGEESVLISRTKNPLGALLLIPMLAVVILVLIIPLIKTLYLSLTKFNVLNLPKFIGIQNYMRLFTEDPIFWIAFKNTFMNAFLVTLVAGTLAFAFSRLIRPAHKAVRYTAVLLFDLISIFVLAGGFNFLFSGDTYGFINSHRFESGTIPEPIQFLSDPVYIPWVQLLLLCLIIFGPLLTLLSFIKTRRIPDSKLLKILLPLEQSLPVYFSGGLPILLLPVCWSTMGAAFGYPSVDYSVHTLTDHLMDYGTMRFEVGFAQAINGVSLFLTAAFLLVFFVLSCCVMNVNAIIKRNPLREKNLSGVKAGNAKIIAAYISGGVLILGAMFFLFPLFAAFMNSFKETSEFFEFPQKIFPKKLSVQNYIDLFDASATDTESFRFSGWLVNMLLAPLLPALAVSVIAGVSACGAAFFEYKTRRLLYILIILSFVLLPTTFIPKHLNSFWVERTLPTAFYTAFFSAAPLIGFVYLKSAAQRVRSYKTIALNCIPVALITFVMCFVNPFVNGFLYSKPSFSIYYFRMQAGGAARLGADSAAKIILTAITFGFLILAGVTAMIFFPKSAEDA